jgi:hypothetical protein
MIVSLRRLIGHAIWRIIVIATDIFGPPDDPWERWEKDVPSRLLSPDAKDDFTWYLSGPSEVPIQSIDEVCAWLATCEYASDEAVHGVAEHWAHPSDFERLRRGDCDDHAIWAWRKLLELGLGPELFVGRKHTHDGWEPHVWVQLKYGNDLWVLDAAVKDRDSLFLPFQRAQAYLRPHFAIGPDLRRSLFGGYLHTIRDKRVAARFARRSTTAA